MDVRKNSVCRLCFEVLHKGISIDETTRQMLDILLVKMNFDVDIKPLMCEGCAKVIKRSLYFILMCLQSERTILLFGIDANGVNVDLRSVFAYNSKAIINRDEDICRFCIRKFDENSFILLDVLMEENTFSDMVKQYMFQMDLNIIKDPLICVHCRSNIESYFKFLRKCRDTEEKITTYQQNEVFRCNLTIKTEEEFNVQDTEVINPFVYQNVESCDHKTCTCGTEGSCFRCIARLKDAAPASENVKAETVPSEANNHTLKVETEKLINKDEVTILHKSGIYKHECVCGYKSNHKGSFKKHLLSHMDFSDAVIYHCGDCDYKTKHKSHFNRHFLTHKVYQCDSCGYQTKYKMHLKVHLLTHKDVSEVQMYQCDRCEFRTKYKQSYQKHVLIHKEFYEVYQCDTCQFRTTSGGTFSKHLSIHKNIAIESNSNVAKMFQSRLKDRLQGILKNGNHDD